MKKKVSNSLVRRVADEMEKEITLDDKIIKRYAEVKGLPERVVRARIMRSTVKRALRLAGGDEKRAKTALAIVNGRQPRLPQCVKLLGLHTKEIVALAYEAKTQTVSAVSLIRLCKMFEHTDGDLSGEGGQLVAILDEIALKVEATEHEWSFHRLIMRRLNEGRMMEAVCDEIMDRIEDPDRILIAGEGDE